MASAPQHHRLAIVLRPARTTDIPVLERLIRASAADLGIATYSPEQLGALIENVFGVDAVLIADGTYFVAEHDSAIVGCGGWSRRATLFGGDRCTGRSDGLIDPGTAPARIRAFFVDAAYSRQGVARRLLAQCEREAAAAGFEALALVATLSGVPFYRAAGFVAGAQIDHDAGGTLVPFIHMTKPLPHARSAGRGQEN